MNRQALTYARYEVLRTFRNTRFFIFSLVFPVVLYLLIAGPNRHEKVSGIPLPLYFMTGMAAFGTMMAIVSTGGRIAAERQVGWNRQLRLTPLRPSAYFSAKVLCGYGLAAVSILVLYALGIGFGVHLSARAWLTMTGLILVGLVPFAALGIAVGHLVSTDSMGPAMGGITSLLALLGGVWGPIAEHGFLHDLSQAIPSYWLVQAGKVALEGHAWPMKGWVVIGIWSLVLGRVAAWSYRRDTARA
ncbi:ABC transporter permease [Aquihabitans sp. G128]|uniref:ABC transporter permease n=1 Tax=Aquihabitans sp. G128 TaxID=2849779 RepID=UPI001C23D45C|nr:ABC transporter permease [Aquihabitans sp. G128]QXC62907.1 ABC transporter permease [Aquihabitans sp. G128]